MTDDAQDKRPDTPRGRSTSGDPASSGRKRRPAEESPRKAPVPPRAPSSSVRKRSAAKPATSAQASAGDDSQEALDRLEALSTPAPTQTNQNYAAPGPAGPAPRLPSQSSRPPQGQARGPAASRSGRVPVARIAAPVVFLVAVIALLSVVTSSGILGGKGSVATGPSAAKTNKAGQTKSTTRKYIVKSGDTLSQIADKFHTTSQAILDLNPHISASTLVVGEKIIVPRP